MVRKFTYGVPINTDAVVVSCPSLSGMPTPFSVEEKNGQYIFTYDMGRGDAVYGLGEQVRGINKRGWIYEGWSTDDGMITESRTSLYAAHNFFVVRGEKTFGVFFDCPGKVVFDIGYTDRDVLTVTSGDVHVYLIEGESVLEVVHAFRKLIGPSYIPPKWAFGFGQSRWGYKDEADVRAVYEGHKKNGLPLDMIYLDIDYMQDYKDFTVNAERFPDLTSLSAELKEDGVRLVPIIDAAVKVQDGYTVYEEGVERGYFCTDENGEPFVVGVWPGDSVLPDVLNPEARAWFGSQYKALLDQGIEGFWNDMNEPAHFYSKRRLGETFEFIHSTQETTPAVMNAIQYRLNTLHTNPEDYKLFYHNAPDGRHVHEEVHNLYGYNMTRAAQEYFGKYDPDKRFLLFSRSSYIGHHRYGGIWTGDNSARWEHLRLNLTQLPNLDMCGFLFTGADIGGFNHDTTEDLMLRWIALGVFTPLLRNHCAWNVRNKELYQWKDVRAFRNLLSVRYTLIPYLYNEFVKCALRGEMLYKPLGFVYENDRHACAVEDQLLVGDSVMIAPVCEQNAKGRYVYLPERMKMIRMRAGDRYTERVMKKGSYYIEIALDEIVFFLREGKVLPLAKPAQNVGEIDMEHLTWLKFIMEPVEYEMTCDDGVTKSDLGKFEIIKVCP